MKHRKIWITLFLTMFRIGLFTFGGGYAMIALLENEFVEKKGWMTKEEFLDMVAIAESTPGPIAINSATYIGYKAAGVPGSAVATLGVSLPSFLIIYAISLFLDRFLSLTYVGYAFKGIQICVIYLIGKAGIKMFRGLKRNAFGLTLLIATAALFILFSLLSVDFSTVFFILIAGSLGVFAYLLHEIRVKGAKK